jgi:hypothetical protein
LLLWLLWGCGDRGPPPHPLPDPKLDIVVEGFVLKINRVAIDIRDVTREVLEDAVGQPSDADSAPHASWNKLGIDVAIGGHQLHGALRVYFQPYGMAADDGMQPFKGRLIVNGAWIHPAAEIFHIEKELGLPCNGGNQGVGRFRREPFKDSWSCDVGGAPFAYWMKYSSSGDKPLAAFDVIYREQPNPAREPMPGPVSPWALAKDAVSVVWDLTKLVWKFVRGLWSP